MVWVEVCVKKSWTHVACFKNVQLVESGIILL